MGAYKTDPNRAVQQSFCYDLSRNWTVSVSWGYTVQLYPSLETAKRLETAYLTFKSWRSWSDEPFTFNTQYFSPNPCERPIIYFLDRVQKVGKGKDQTLTTYERVKSEHDKDCDNKAYAPALAVKRFQVSASTLDPDHWKLVRLIFLFCLHTFVFFEAYHTLFDSQRIIASIDFMIPKLVNLLGIWSLDLKLKGPI